MVVVGHSMGGVISRMMISSDNGALDAWLAESLGTNQIPASIAELAHFQPMPQIGRVIFIAAPHNGTHVAGGKVGKLVSKVVRLPFQNFAHARPSLNRCVFQ
jgi:triacylglycerol esterase/lipase EstA (alpha/beta hydrolase family)